MRQCFDSDFIFQFCLTLSGCGLPWECKDEPLAIITETRMALMTFSSSVFVTKLWKVSETDLIPFRSLKFQDLNPLSIGIHPNRPCLSSSFFFPTPIERLKSLFPFRNVFQKSPHLWVGFASFLVAWATLFLFPEEFPVNLSPGAYPSRTDFLLAFLVSRNLVSSEGTFSIVFQCLWNMVHEDF